MDRNTKVKSARRPNRRFPAAVLACAVLAGLLIAVPGLIATAGPAGASVAGSSHKLPGKGVSGVTQLCGPSASYSCDTGGYSGQSTSWWGSYYGAGQASRNSYGYHNCTLYAAYRIAQNGAPNPGWHANASGWATEAASHGTLVNQTPAVEAVAQWNANHVAYVEAVTSSYIEVTDDNYKLNTTDRFRIATGSAAWPDNFIHFHDVFRPSNTFGWQSMSYLGTDTLTGGQGLRANQYIMSQNGEFALALTGNGNLAEFGSSKPGELWNNNVYSGSLTYDSGGLDLQFDGNLVDYNGNGSPLWATGTSGRDDLVLQNDGNLVMYNSSGAPIWSDGAGGSFTASNTWTNTLVDGQSLPTCAMLTSADGRFHLLEECNGDLYEYGPGNSPMWQTGTNSPGAVLALQGGDGNLVMYSTMGVPLWSSGTGGNLGDDLAIQDDGNVVLYSSKGVPLWSTGT